MKIGVRQARDGPGGIKSVVIDEKRWRRHESSGKRAGIGQKGSLISYTSSSMFRVCSSVTRRNKKKFGSRWIKRITYDYKGSSYALRATNLIPISTSYKQGFLTWLKKSLALLKILAILHELKLKKVTIKLFLLNLL